MRTTLAIDDGLLVAGKSRARELGLTLGQLVERALQRELSASAPRQSQPVDLPVFTGGTGPAPGLDLLSNRAISEFLDEGLPLHKLR